MYRWTVDAAEDEPHAAVLAKNRPAPTGGFSAAHSKAAPAMASFVQRKFYESLAAGLGGKGGKL